MTFAKITILTLALASPAFAQDKSGQTSGDAMGANHGHDATSTDTGPQKDQEKAASKSSKKSKSGAPKAP